MFGLEATCDEELHDGLKTLARRDRETQGLLVAHLAEMAARQAFVALGYASLWAYVTEALGFSGGMAQKRIAASRVAAKFPEAVDMIDDGRISLCAVAALEKALPEMPDAKLLHWAAGKTKREVEDRVRGPGEKPPEKNELRKVWDNGDGTGVHELRVTEGDELAQNLRRLCDLIGTHKLGLVVLKATEKLLDDIDPERRQRRREQLGAKAQQAPVTPPKNQLPAEDQPAQDSPESSQRRAPRADYPGIAGRPASTVTRYVPRWLRDFVLVRDGHRCKHVGRDGRCSATRYLQIDHVMPFALGNRSLDPNDYQTLCASHNLHRARKTFGGLVPRREVTV